MNRLREFLKRSKKTALLIAVVAALTILITSFVAIWLERIGGLRLPSLGTLVTLDVEAYWDVGLTNETKTIAWGTIWPGATQNVTVYIKSISNVETTLKLETANWTFLDEEERIVVGPINNSPYLNLTWNYNQLPVYPNETIPVILTLTAARSSDFANFLITNDITRFSFVIIISAQ